MKFPQVTEETNEIKFSNPGSCPLTPAFWRILDPTGSTLWNHYRYINRESFLAWYDLKETTVFEGCSDGNLDGLMIQLTHSEFRSVADRSYAGFQFWKIQNL